MAAALAFPAWVFLRAEAFFRRCCARLPGLVVFVVVLDVVGIAKNGLLLPEQGVCLASDVSVRCRDAEVRVSLPSTCTSADSVQVLGKPPLSRSVQRGMS